MGSVGCDGEDKLRPTSTKKLKLPRKVLEACDGVNPPSVPRKLRSVIKKRSCKPNSPALPIPKRLNQLVNSFQTSKKSKSNMGGKNHKDIFPKPATSEQISKDEEEVAEALFALAGMTSNNSTAKADDSESPTGTVAKLEDSRSAYKDLSVPNKESEVKCTKTRTEVINTTLSNKLSREDNAATDGLKESSTLLSHPNLFDHFMLNLNSNAPALVKFPALSTLPKTLTQNCFMTPAQGPICPQANPTLERLNVLRETGILNAQMTSTNAGDVAYQVQPKHSIAGTDGNGQKLWPGLNTRKSDGTEAPQPQSQTQNPTNQSWSSIVTSSKTAPHVSWEKVPESSTLHGKKRSRCVTHVYVSHLTRSLQVPEGQLRPSEGDIDLNSSSSQLGPHSHSSSFIEKSFLEDSNTIRASKRLQLDQEASGNSILRKQRIDFLSLSTPVKGELEAKSTNDKRNGILMGPSSEPSVHQPNSVAPHSVVASLSSLQSNLIPYQNQPSASAPSIQSIPQVHLPLPPYLGRIHGPAHIDNYAMQAMIQPYDIPQRSQQQQPLQHQNPIWIAQVPNTYRPTGAPFWPNNNKRQDPNLAQYIQTPLLPTSHSSASLEGLKYLPISQPNRQKLMAFGSSQLPPIKAKAPAQSLAPLDCDTSVARFPYPEAVLKLQLL